MSLPSNGISQCSLPRFDFSQNYSPILNLNLVSDLSSPSSQTDDVDSLFHVDFYSLDPNSTKSTSPNSTSKIENTPDILDPCTCIAKDLLSLYQPSSLDQKPTTVFQSQERFTILLEAPTSIAQRIEEDTLTYLNKSQFYTINFQANFTDSVDPKYSNYPQNLVRSVIHLLFHHEKDQFNEKENWRYWRSQQVKSSQKGFDVHRETCEGVIELEELAFNCVSLIWDVHEGAKVPICVNCLSTDFSAQKGVRGVPMRIQVDTYDDIESGYYEAIPIHRCFSQIKVFRDKGAERKNKDEAKTAEKRIVKLLKHHQSKYGDTQSFRSPFVAPSAWTKLTGTTPLGIKPALLDSYLKNTSQSHSQSEETLEGETSPQEVVGNLHDLDLDSKQAASILQSDFENLDVEAGLSTFPNRKISRKSRSVLTIYVKTEAEKVYNPIHLQELTVEDLKLRIGAKYEIPAEMIRHVYKRTRKGIVVHLDDKVVELFGDEDDFIIHLEFDNIGGSCSLSLMSS